MERRIDLGLLGAAALGAVVFVVFVGTEILNPTNVRWLLMGDTAQNYLGWQFFRKTPLLQWPLGANPNFGVGFSSSIVFADLIPGLALLFKPVQGLLPREFQYFGWWLLTCFVLQATFAWKLASHWLSRTVARYVVVGFFLVQPAWLYRMTFEGYGHLALSGHFLLLWALVLALHTRWSRWQWWSVLAVSLSVTLYLFIMVGVIYVFSLISQALRTREYRPVISHAVIAVLVASSQAWAFGMFMAGDTTDSGLGQYRATLASLVDPFDGFSTSWSRILPDFVSTTGSQEGFSFVGIGVVLLLVVVAVIVAVQRRLVFVRTIAAYWHVCAALSVLAFLSLSPRVGFAGRDLFSYSVPDTLLPIFSSLRSSGRLMWLPAYALTIVAIVRVVQLRTVGVWVALFALFLQITDSMNALRETRERFTDINVTLVTDDPRWTYWVKDKKHLVSVPPLNNDPLWIDLAVLADRHGMTTNAAYVSRTDTRAFEILIAQTQEDLETLSLDRETLYIITNYPPNPISTSLKATNQVPIATYARPSRDSRELLILPAQP